jgi:mono/diheme cytochrome c family protein
LLMPGVSFLRNLSDEDMQAIIAYLRGQPAVQNSLPATNPSLVLTFLIGARLAPITRDVSFRGAVAAPPKAATPEYGAYLVSFQECRICHDEDLQGRPNPGLFPVSPPALPFIHAWSQDEFITTMRTGVAPGGYVIKPSMPTKQIAAFDDIELAAMYQYLLGLK